VRYLFTHHEHEGKNIQVTGVDTVMSNVTSNLIRFHRFFLSLL